MAELAKKHNPPAPPRKPLTAADVARLVDRRVPNVQDPQGRIVPCYDLLHPEWRSVYERLRRDPDGTINAAFNRLCRHNPELVLADLVLALRAAAALPQIPEARAQAKKQRARAEALRRLAAEYDRDARGAIVLAARTLRDLAGEATIEAERIEAAIASGPWSRKTNDQAYVGVAVRDLSRRLFGDTRADHEAIRLLLTAAIGHAVEAATVANAIRSVVRTNARSKAKIGRERAFSKKCR